MMYHKGTEDWCHPETLTILPYSPKKEIVIVTVYPDCKLFMGVTPSGNIQGWAKVIDGKTVWVKCSDAVPKFKERFYDTF